MCIRTAALRCANLNAKGVHNSFKWAVLGARFDPEVAINLALVLAFSRECWANGLRGAGNFLCPSDGLKGYELWQVQANVSAYMSAVKDKAEVPDIGVNLSRLGRSLAARVTRGAL